jgi:TonB-linked SusC/RagA family outer membrane protein
LFFFSIQFFAQGFNVSGTVTSSDDGTVLPGVTILLQDSNTGTITDPNGRYSISIPDGNSVLIFSFIGYANDTIEVAHRQNINVTLQVATESLDEVVVTALGIERDVKSIGYAVQKVPGEDLIIARNESAVNQLAGKVTGLTISETNGGAGSSTRILLRGNNSFTNNNQALIVVDGVPMENTTISNAEDTWGGRDYGNGVSDINPDDIESVSVLKGAGASALYGSSAANGVILFTTKKGSQRKGIGVNFTSNTSLNQAYIHYNLQNIYGAGRNGKFAPPFKTIDGVPNYDVTNPSAYGSWGPKMTGQDIVDWDGKPTEYNPQPTNYKDYFRNSWTTNNNLSLFGGGKNVTYRFSIGDIRTNEIIYNAKYARTNLGLNLNATFAKKFTLTTYVSYVRSKTSNRFNLSDSHDNPNRNYIMMPRHISNTSMENYMMDEEGNEQTWYMNWAWMTNPFYGPRYRLNDDLKNRIFGNIALTYSINDHLSVMLRTAPDFGVTLGTQQDRKGGLVNSQGGYGESEITQFLINTDFLVSYTNQVAENFFYTINLGGNSMYRRTDRYNANTQGGLIIDGDYSLENSVNPIYQRSMYYEKAINSLYAFAELDYRHFLFLDITGRNDWASTLPEGNNAYFYPSVSLGFVFSELLNMTNRGKRMFSFGKIRASYAEVGMSAQPYQLEPVFIVDSTSGAFGTYSHITNTIPNANLKPERLRSLEFGADFRFFLDRLSFDFTFYKTNSTDQIVEVDVSAASGSTRALINAGNIENKGIELQLRAEPVKAKNFVWDFVFNYTKNNSTVLELAPGIDNIQLLEHWRLSIEARPGNPYGDIVGFAIQRDDQGRKMVDEFGMYIKDSVPRVLGNSTPDYSFSYLNNFRFRGFTVSFLIDARIGGELFAGTNMYGYGYAGNFEETLPGREGWYASEAAREEAGSAPEDWTATGGFLAEGVYAPGTTINDEDMGGQPNQTFVNPELYWDQFSSWTNEIHEPFVYDASFVKLRELILTYQFPKKLISKIKMKHASLSFYCRNVWLIYKNVPNIDPETFYTNDNGQGYELYSYPNKRSYGFSLSFGF